MINPELHRRQHWNKQAEWIDDKTTWISTTCPAPLSVALPLHFHHGKNWHSFSGFKNEKRYNLRGEQRLHNGRIPCMCLQCMKGVENDLPLKCSVRNSSLCKTKEFGNSEYLLHWNLAVAYHFVIINS